jgi:CRP-like cAMP-binding protein
MKNRVLEIMPASERRILAMQMMQVNLPRSTVLFEAGDTPEYVYFPLQAIVSYLSSTTDGQSIEVGLVGNEGVVGIATVFGHVAAFRAVVQVPGPCLRISRSALKIEFQRSDQTREVLLEYANALLIQIAQTAVCNKFHSIEARFCRWLLMAHDRSSAPLTLTHEAIARILGTRRASITIVAGKLQKAGAIRYNRGVLTIQDRSALQQIVCECYETIVAAHDNF